MTLPAQHVSIRATQQQAASTQVGLCRCSAVECCDVPVNIIVPRRIRRSGRQLAARAKLYLTAAAKERQMAAIVTTSAKYPRDRQAALKARNSLLNRVHRVPRSVVVSRRLKSQIGGVGRWAL